MAWWDNLLGRTPQTIAPPMLSAASDVEVLGGPQGGSVSSRSSATRSSSSRWWGGGSYDMQRDEAIDATPLSVKQIFDEAATGRTRRMVDLYKSVRRYDSRLDAVCATRVLAISSRSWVLRAPPGLEQDPRALDVARRVTSALNEVRGLSTLIGHLGHGVLEHDAILEHRWSRSRRLGGMWNTHPQWVHPNRIGWRLPDVIPAWADTETNVWDGKPIAGRPLSDWPDRFVFFAPVAGRSDYPWHRGALRARVGPSTVKRLTGRFWVKLLERWGQPQVVAYRDGAATGGAGSTDDEADKVIDALRAIGSDWRGVFPPGWKVESINVQVAENLHRLFIEHQNVEDAVAVLGQNLSTEIKGGSFAAAKAHQLVRLDILASDLAELAECITDQWIEPLVRYNFGLDAPVPYFDFVLGSRSEITVQAYMAGLFSADEARASMGYDPELGDSGRRYFMGAAPSTKVVTGRRIGAGDDEEPIDVEVEEDPKPTPTEDA